MYILTMRKVRANVIYRIDKNIWSIRAQDKTGIENNSKIFFLFLKENKCCDPSLEPSRRDGSNDWSRNMFFFVELLG